jgi:arylsulfatase A-like enzyme
MNSPDRRSFVKGALGTAVAATVNRFSVAASLGSQRRPNILLISTDQQSLAAMSCRIGTQWIHTPNMDSLALSGMQFLRAYAANPLCCPSRTSMYSGHYPVQTGIETNPGNEDNLHNNHEPRVYVDSQRIRCMGTIFKNAGYETSYFGKWHIAYPENKPETHGFGVVETKAKDVGIADEAVVFLGKPHRQPFLAVASFVNPHNICEWARGERLPEGPIGEAPPADECPPLRSDFIVQKNEPEIMALMRRSYQSTPVFPVGDFDQGKWRQYQWAYYRLIEKVDVQIGRVLQALKANNLEKDTLVVFFADHGDCQGAHHWNQKTVFYEESVGVPFIFTYKGTIPAGVSDRLVNTGTDLLPTLCDFAGVVRSDSLPGMSLKDTALGNSHRDPSEYVVSSNDLAQGGPIDGITPRAQGRMLVSKRYKYCIYASKDPRVADAPRESLTDREKDPGELVNVAEEFDYREALTLHRKMLAQWCHRYGDSFPVKT